MLFIQTRSLALTLDEGERLRLLDALDATGLRPLIRSARRRMFQSLVSHVGGGEAARVEAAASEVERECAARRESEGEGAYTPGDLFCAGDCVLSLSFDEGARGGLGASVVYSLDTSEPLAQLERFCRDVRDALNEIRASSPEAASPETETAKGQQQPLTGEGQRPDLPRWQTRPARQQGGLARFIAAQPTDFVRAAAALRGGRELARASELMQEQAVRSFLRRVQELRQEGYTPRRLFAEAGGVSVQRMMEAGLLEREVRVSCRKSGHALFDLPSPDSLAAVTISRAKCSQCAAPVADEVIEETINPTRLAVSLLEDGGWLNNRVYKTVRSLGVPDSEIASGPASPHGESHLAADVCGDSFLFVTRDGDLTPAFCRRAAQTVEETEAAHLVVVVTGAVEDEGRLRLYEFAWRRARAGRDLGMTIIEGLGGMRAEIERAFEGALRRQLSHSLFPLDAALGFSASGFVLNWFKLKRASGEKRPAAEALTPLFLGLDQKVAS